MFAAYATITIFGALLYGSAAVVYLIGHEFPKAQLDIKGLPRSWVPVLGMMLALGALGLLGGFVIPLLGTLSAYSLVVYFAIALLAHLRVGSRKLGNWALFFCTAVAALGVDLLYHWW
ncbi:DoxX family protein [Spongiactinospora sp. TRM90649]|uniref:DoxX family protein n=1 Tax=Spongiactinospora sp. TRM90649 TaxID=3031114 RepID=UPI0023F974AC|nr:DoxX family protein [Spongiactinospora sp. TRM90649]MDF5755662.1 DoxX family protein [Spongiactinospora sp. TRM90649]